jgi:hypothetical protein
LRGQRNPAQTPNVYNNPFGQSTNKNPPAPRQNPFEESPVTRLDESPDPNFDDGITFEEDAPHQTHVFVADPVPVQTVQ